MRRYILIVAMLSTMAVPAAAHAVDFGQVVGSAIKGAQQIAEASKEITPAEEYYIGRAVAATLLVDRPLLGNPGLTKYVNEIGESVAYESDRPSTYGGYHFAVLNIDEQNAYACPGGLIFITKGLLKILQNEDQLAAVLAHEVAHVAHRHSIKSIKRSRWTNFAFFAAGEAASNLTPSDVQQITGVFQDVVSDISKQVIMSGYSQGDEKDADTSGMKYAGHTGYNPEEMIAFFNVMESKGLGTKSGPFSSHPDNQSRVSSLEKAKGDIPNPAPTEKVRTDRFSAKIASIK